MLSIFAQVLFCALVGYLIDYTRGLIIGASLYAFFFGGVVLAFEYMTSAVADPKNPKYKTILSSFYRRVNTKRERS